MTKKTTAFVYRSTCLVHFTMLAPACLLLHVQGRLFYYYYKDIVDIV